MPTTPTAPDRLYSPFFPGTQFDGVHGTTLPATRNVNLGDWNAIALGTILNIGDIVQYLGSSFMVNLTHTKTSGTATPPSNSNYSILASSGTNGQTLYTWFAYADSADGTVNFTTGVGGTRAYIGIANNQTSAIESTNPVDYTWTKIQGPQGIQGNIGPSGLNSAEVFLYQRSASVPPVPSVTTTYTFATAILTGINNGWSQSIPASNGNPLYVTVASASNSGSTDTIAPSEWATPVIMAQDGAGGVGSNGTNAATIFLFQRANSAPAVPSNTTTYNFTTGVLSNINNGWSQSIPNSNGLPCYVTTASALSTTNTDNIGTSEWATPTILAVDGQSPFLAVLSIDTITVAADYTGVTKTSQLPKTSLLTVTQGSSAVGYGSISTVLTSSDSSAIIASYNSTTGYISITTANSPGYIDVAVYVSGTLIATPRIQILRQLDPQPPASQTSAGKSFNTVIVSTQSSFNTTPDTSTILMAPNASGQLRITLSAEYTTDYPNSLTNYNFTGQAKAIYRVAGSGSYADLTVAATGASSSYSKVTGEATPASIGTDQTAGSLTPGVTYEIGFVFRKSAGTSGNGAFIDGNFGVQQP